MPPSKTIDDAADRCLRDAELFGQHSLRLACCIARPNAGYRIVIQMSPVMTRSAVLPTLRHFIHLILTRRSGKQMVATNAWRVVASVADIVAVWYGPDLKLIPDALRVLHRLAYADLPVANVGGCFPHPTRRLHARHGWPVLVHLRPEAIGERSWPPSHFSGVQVNGSWPHSARYSSARRSSSGCCATVTHVASRLR